MSIVPPRLQPERLLQKTLSCRWFFAAGLQLYYHCQSYETVNKVTVTKRSVLAVVAQVLLLIFVAGAGKFGAGAA